MWSSGVLYWGNPEKTASVVEPWGTILGDANFGFSSGPCPFSYSSIPTIKPHFHPVGCHVWMFLLPPAESTAEEEEGAGGKLATLLHPRKVLTQPKEPGRPPAPSSTPALCVSLPRDDSDAEDDWLTLKAMSESLSSWEPLRDPDGDVVAGLDCRVPETKETP